MKKPVPVRYDHLSGLVRDQGHATVAVLYALVASLVEEGSIDPERFNELLKKFTVTLYGAGPPPNHFQNMTGTIAKASQGPVDPSE